MQSDAAIERVLLIPNICNFTFPTATRIFKTIDKSYWYSTVTEAILIN